jgi:hypothetical protein
MSLLEKLQKTSKVAGVSVLSESKIFDKKELTPTPVGMINVALSGSIKGGLASGLTVLAGPSKHFKTSFALLMASAYLKKHPVTNIEELKFDIVNQLEQINRKDKVIVIIDSIGNIASKKELDDALNEKSVADMTRAKALKGLFRMVTPMLTLKDIPLLAINHTYQEQGLFPKQIVSGGTGIYYSADNIWIIGRQQEKVGTEVEGYNFIINVEKSRFVKEKSKIPINVTWEGGINQSSGFLEAALMGGYVVKPKAGWYMAKNPETGEELSGNLRAKQLDNEFWQIILHRTDFISWIEKKYKISSGPILQESSDDTDTES